MSSQTRSRPPIFQHDCDICVYLGDLTLGNAECSEITATYDLYFCAKTPTVIARYGDHGSEYYSGLRLAEHMPELAEAERRAKKRELL